MFPVFVYGQRHGGQLMLEGGHCFMQVDDRLSQRLDLTHVWIWNRVNGKDRVDEAQADVAQGRCTCRWTRRPRPGNDRAM